MYRRLEVVLKKYSIVHRLFSPLTVIFLFLAMPHLEEGAKILNCEAIPDTVFLDKYSTISRSSVGGYLAVGCFDHVQFLLNIFTRRKSLVYPFWRSMFNMAFSRI